MANLLQVSSAFGRAMEAVDRSAMSPRRSTPSCWTGRPPAPTSAPCATSSPPSAEGYAFPTNLDRDQPIGGLAPETQAELVWRALSERWPAEALGAELSAQAERHTSAQ